MATKRKNGSRKGNSKRRSTKKKGLMGLPESGGTVGQKFGRAALYLAAGLAGGAAGSAVGRNSGLIGLGSLAATPFLPEQFAAPVAIAGVSMLVVSPKAAQNTVSSDIKGLSGFEGFIDDAKSRLKNFAAELSEKAYVDAPVKKVLGIQGFGEVANYYPSGSASTDDQYTRLLARAMTDDSSVAGLDDSLLAGVGESQDSLLAGIGSTDLNNLDF